MKYHTQKSIFSLENLFLTTLILEPLLFFVLADRNTFGFNINISRILQVVVIISLAIKFLIFRSQIVVSNQVLKLASGYILYTSYMIGLTVIGVFTAIYGKSPYNLLPPRVIVEVIISIYYFVYFSILPMYFFRSHASRLKVMWVIKTTFIIFLFLGFLDLFLFRFGLPSIPRHIGDVEVGFRFHSIAGEPRDAAIFLIFCLSSMYLFKIYDASFKISNTLVLSSITALILTVSVSAILSMAFIFILLFFYFLRINFLTFSLIKYIYFLFFVAISSYVLYLLVLSSERMQLYIDAFGVLYGLLKQGLVPETLSGQMVNIYPIWQRFQELLDFNFFGIIFGSGIGSSSILNNIFYDSANLSTGELLNPHANIIRLFYEGGILGSIFFLFGFIYSFRYLELNTNELTYVNYLFLVIFGAFMAHRSLIFFIFVGLIFMLFNRKNTYD